MENSYTIITSILKYASYKTSSNPLKILCYHIIIRRAKKKLKKYFLSDKRTLIGFFMEIVDLYGICYSNIFKPFIKSRNGFARLIGKSDISLLFDKETNVIIDTLQHNNITKTKISWNKKEISFEITNTNGVISRFSIVENGFDNMSEYKANVLNRLRNIFIEISCAIVDNICV